jgi:hypothetical protein
MMFKRLVNSIGVNQAGLEELYKLYPPAHPVASAGKRLVATGKWVADDE